MFWHLLCPLHSGCFSLKIGSGRKGLPLPKPGQDNKRKYNDHRVSAEKEGLGDRSGGQDELKLGLPSGKERKEGSLKLCAHAQGLPLWSLPSVQSFHSASTQPLFTTDHPGSSPLLSIPTIPLQKLRSSRHAVPFLGKLSQLSHKDRAQETTEKIQSRDLDIKILLTRVPTLLCPVGIGIEGDWGTRRGL